MRKYLLIVCVIALWLGEIHVNAQNKLTREEILSMTTEQLSELPLEDLMQAVETLGVSSIDELFSLIMNKNVSSASKQEENSFTSPLSSTVITREEMRTYGISTIEEAFRLIPGMIVSEKYNGIYDVQMRGLSNIPDNNLLYYTDNMNVLLMIDGRISHNYGMGSPIMEFLPISIEDIERIEVVRGATSALYGPNAVNGVINIITTKPDKGSHIVDGSIQMGNNTAVADFGIRKSINSKISLGLTANAQIRNRLTDKIYLLPSSGAYLVNNESALSQQPYWTKEGIGQLIATGALTDYTAGGRISIEQYKRTIGFAQLGTTEYYNTFNYKSVEGDPNASWKDPDMSRRTYGVNGYLTIVPNNDVRIDLTCGYQDAWIQNTSVGNDDSAPRGRKAKTWYANLNTSIYDLKLAGDFSSGDYDFIVASNGFQMNRGDNMHIQAEYDININDLQIRPGVSYQTVYYKETDANYFDYGYGPEELCSFFGYISKGDNSTWLYDFAPSLRLDYKADKFRVIGAARIDKTRFPDKWNPSWQFSASYQLNENNFIRFVYGRSFRSNAFANTSSKYTWPRTGRGMPSEMQYLGNTESPLVHIDNFELGYRWRPTNSVLLDAEAFYSKSQDYGALKSYASMLIMKESDINNSLNSLIPQLLTGALSTDDMSDALMGIIGSKSQLKYDKMPFKVSQLGISLNLDWIISSKLIAKLNANVQRTTIDKYYQYSQAEMIMKQLTTSYATTMATLPSMMNEIITSAAMSGDVEGYVTTLFGGQVMTHEFDAEYAERGDALLNEILAAYQNGTYFRNCDNPLGLYYTLKYNIEYDVATSEYNFASSASESAELTNGHKHKATPSVYGMVGLIYKPLEQLSISAFGNYQSKREYTTNYGVAKVDPNFTLNMKIGYKPIAGFELFFNAHNLLNSQKEEFIYTDKIQGIYTIGANFSL